MLHNDFAFEMSATFTFEMSATGAPAPPPQIEAACKGGWGTTARSPLLLHPRREATATSCLADKGSRKEPPRPRALLMGGAGRSHRGLTPRHRRE